MDTLNQLINWLSSQIGIGKDAGTLLTGILSAVIALPMFGMGIPALWRKLKPLQPPLKPALCGCEPIASTATLTRPGLLERCTLGLDYLRTRREWRYAKPWIMVLGEQGAGKTSLLASLAAKHQQALHGRYTQLAIKGTEWHDLNKGFFIDPKGQLPYQAAASQAITSEADDSAEKSDASKDWEQVLKQLVALRPERALDGVLLVISAQSLQQNSPEQREANANNIRRQLQAIEQRFEFALPVYVVVTTLDTVPGFAAFWRAQSVARRAEMVGWSAPAQTSDSPPSAWAEAAFKQVGQQLKPLQLETLAHGNRIPTIDADPFLLFPRHFQQLREPFQDCLSIIFQATPWQTTFFCRGIYFTGVVADKGNAPVAQAAPRQDVAFVTDLILKKILAEPGLGRRTRAGVWSRNALIRRLQVALVASFALLLVAFVAACFRIDSQVDGVVSSLKRVAQMQASVQSDGTCVLQEPVYQLLDQIAAINTEARSWVIPLSLLDNRLSRKSARRIADAAFKSVILPGLACQLEQRGKEISSQSNSISDSGLKYPQARAALLAYVQQITELEKNAARFNRLLDTPPFASEKEVLPEFIKLTEYAYAAPLPTSLSSNSGLLPASLHGLNRSDYSSGLRLPNNFKRDASTYLAAQATQVNLLLMAELDQGSQLLDLLEQKQTPILANINSFTAWLSWVRESWLGSNLTHNPLLDIQTELAAKLQPLIRDYAFPAIILKPAVSQFDAVNQYPKAMNRLNEMSLPEYGFLFTLQNKQLDLNPKLLNELVGLQALSAVDYMAVNTTLPFVCKGQVADWNVDYINQAAGYFKQYQGFLANPLLKDGGVKTLYQQLASFQLELVLNNSLQQAQSNVPTKNSAQINKQTSGLASSAALPTNNASALGSVLEQRESRESVNFAKLLPALQTLQGIYQTQAFTTSAANLDQCLSQFSHDNLQQVQLLVEQSLLYQIIVNGDASDTDTNFFDPGSTPVVKDFLARQLSRVQVLVGYATPFLDFLKKSTSVTSPTINNTYSAPYWSNTAIELDRYTQAKDPNAQASLLENIFLKQLPELNSDNCNSILNAYQSPAFGNDLFSNYRQQLEHETRSLCSSKRSIQATALYQQLASRFNRDIAGRYPFGALNTSDANLATVKAFLNDYEASRDALMQSLTGLTSASWATRRSFLTQLNSVAAFLHNSLSQPGGTGALITLGVNFRVLPGEGSDQIASWRLATGGNSIAYPNQVNSLDWPFGQALALDLVWAKSSFWRPASTTSVSDLQVDGSTATFTANANWALLRLIASHQSSAQLDTLSTNTVLLEFNVPLIGTETAGKASFGNATLYLSLQLSSNDPKTMAPVSLQLPDSFPYAAPL